MKEVSGDNMKCVCVRVCVCVGEREVINTVKEAELLMR